MQFFKSVLVLTATLLFVNCANESKPKVEKPEGIEIIKSELVEYPLNDTLVVHSIDAEFLNHDESAEYLYIATLFQGEKSWVDSTVFMAIKDEPARLQVIFGESQVLDELAASFSGKLVAIQDTTDVK